MCDFPLLIVFLFATLTKFKIVTASPHLVNYNQPFGGYSHGYNVAYKKSISPLAAPVHLDYDDGNDPDAVRMRAGPKLVAAEQWRGKSQSPKWRQPVSFPSHPMQAVHIARETKGNRGHANTERNENFEDFHVDRHSNMAAKSTLGTKREQGEGIQHHQNDVNLHIKGSQSMKENSTENLSKNGSTLALKSLDTGVDQGYDDPKRQNVSKSSIIDEEEGKLRLQTDKLVKWLRNRLRKRLREVADLEHEMQTEQILLQNLNQSIANTSMERKNEIRLKIDNQKRLKTFQKSVLEPDEQIQEVSAENNKLTEELGQITRTYEALAQVHRNLNTKLQSTGLSHWLETRGKEYLPETAVGVLSKSAEVLSPVTEGIEKAYEIDNHLLEEVEHVVPVLAKKTIVSKVIEDLATILPLLPIFVLCYRLMQIFDSLSVLHVVFYSSAALVVELLLIILLSMYLGHEALHVCQKRNEPLLSGGLLFNFAVILGLLGAQVLICVLHTRQSEVAQLILTAIVAHHFWQHVFVPTMVGHPITTTVIANVGYIFALGFVCYQKKEILNWQTSYDPHVAKAWKAASQWTHETAQAMGNVFNERNPEIQKDDDDERSITSLNTIDDSTESDTSTMTSLPQRPYGRDTTTPNDDVPSSNLARPVEPGTATLHALSSYHAGTGPQTRYGRWTGLATWPARSPVPTNGLRWNDDEPARGRVAMSRTHRIARYSRFNANSAHANVRPN